MLHARRPRFALARRLANGYEVSAHQSEIIPRKLLAKWEPPDNFGKAAHERTHEWTRGYRLTLEATGLDQAHCTELSGRHYIETTRSQYLQLKAVGGHDSQTSKNSPTHTQTHTEIAAHVYDDDWLGL